MPLNEPLQQGHLIEAFSEPRLARYVLACQGNFDLAIEVHHWNTRIGHTLYFCVQMFELLLRNTIDRRLAEGFGPDWLLDKPHWLEDMPGRENRQRRKVEEVFHHVAHVRKEVVSHGKVVAELPLSFWECLLAKAYTDSLWIPWLKSCFANAAGMGRSDIKFRIERIRQLRNRISHHEPVILSTFGALLPKEEIIRKHEQVVEAMSWMSMTQRDTLFPVASSKRR